MARSRVGVSSRRRSSCPCVHVQNASESRPMKIKYDCATCPGYCCSHSRIAISEHDIARLAKHFGLTPAQAKTKFTYHYQTKEVDEQLLRHKKDHIYKSICRFFDTDER